MGKETRALRKLPAGPNGAQIRTRLLSWYRRNGRVLPWRETSDPYAVWISEVMLQQTQVTRVLPYYERFLQRFPCVKSLAESSWRQVLPYWRGLGYYSRGKNLLLSARAIAASDSGAFPATIEELERLPGVGRYTARAVLSFAFGAELAALDTNLKRVIGRVTGVDEKGLEQAAADLYRGTGKRAAALNHALMDVGALFCKSRSVLCETCPLRSVCVSKEKVSEALRRKVEQAPKVRPSVHVGAACIHRDGKFLLAERSSGEWEFPGGKREPGEDIRTCLKREIQEELGVEISVRPAFLTEDFMKGGKLYRLHFCRSQILRGRPRCLEHRRLLWVKADELAHYPLADTNKRAAARLGQAKKGS